jgi:hypothetical protein
MADRRCSRCKSLQNIFPFCCGHKICSECLVNSTLKSLKSLKILLKRDSEILNGRASHIGCPSGCAQTELSISLKFINKFAQNSLTLPNSDKLIFREMTSIASSFFSGIRTYFFECVKCLKIKSDVKKAFLMCKDCIQEVFVDHLGGIPASYEILYENNRADILSVYDRLGPDFYLVNYDDERETYIYENSQRNEEFIIIPKFGSNGHQGYALIIKAVVTENNNNFIEVPLYDSMDTIIVSKILIN